jgi:hypothetical protein
MSTCNTPPKNKKDFIVKLGNDLHTKYGKKPFYSVKETKDSMKSLNYPFDFFCWGHAVFNAPLDFQRYHQSIGETCDQAEMKAEMGNAFANTSDGSWFDVDLSWLEWPDIDFGSFFDFTL